MAATAIKIAALYQTPQHVRQVAEWSFAQWPAENAAFGLHSVEEIAADYHESYMSPGPTPDRPRIPTTFVALDLDDDGGAPCGTVTLEDADLADRELGPWVAAVYVPPRSRRRGIATALIRHVLRLGVDMGMKELLMWFPAASAGRYA